MPIQLPGARGAVPLKTVSQGDGTFALKLSGLAAPPVNTGLPVVTGTAELGATLSTTDGTWTGTAPAYTYQWKRGGVNIGGAAANTYVLVSADLGTTITVTVTATNAAGSASATSAGLAIGNWLLFDRFTTTQAAPLTSPRTCEPGPSTLTITDTGNKLSISSAKLIASGAQSAFSDPKVAGALIARVAGRALMVKGGKGASWRVGYADSIDNLPRAGVLFNPSVFHYDNANLEGQLVSASGATAYDALVVQQDYGAWSAIKGGAWAAWTLLFHGGVRLSGSTITNANDTQKIYSDIAAAWEVDDIIQWDLGGSFSRSFLWGAGNIEPDPTGVTLISAADVFATVEWSPATAATLELSIRRTDDDNRWIVRGAETGSTIKLIERNAGAETERATAAFTWGTTDKKRVWVRAEGQRVCFGTDAAQQGVYTTATFNLTATGAKVSASNTLSLATLRVVPLAVPTLPAEGVSSGLAPLNLFPVGDSKTDATSTDSARPFGISAGFPRFLTDSVEQTSVRGCYERSPRIGIGGGTAASIDTNMATYLSTRNHIPDYILVNIGANDVGTAQATFEAAYGSLLDKMHTKWPNAHMYCMRVWVRSQLAACNNIATWIANVLATRSTWAHLGPDERIFLENGDNGVTYTSDGVHPNRAGYILTAAQWKTVLGI